jgi:hypothetical protein
LESSIQAERVRKIALMLLKMESVLNRFKFLNNAGVGVDIVERGDNWFREAEARGIELSKFDSLFSGVHTIETMLLMHQAHDAYVVRLLDAVPVLCRTALEEELTIRYLIANSLVPQIAAGTRFKTLVDGKTPANLEPLIQWATTTTPPILTGTNLSFARDVQEVGNDYAHAFAMRRAAKPMTGTGNLFTNIRALEVYEKTVKALSQMP